MDNVPVSKLMAEVGAWREDADRQDRLADASEKKGHDESAAAMRATAAALAACADQIEALYTKPENETPGLYARVDFFETEDGGKRTPYGDYSIAPINDVFVTQLLELLKGIPQGHGLMLTTVQMTEDEFDTVPGHRSA